MPEAAWRFKREIDTSGPGASNDMLIHMKRTTLQIDTALYAELRRRAAGEGRTLTEVLEHALRAGLAAPRDAKRPRVALPSYDLGPFLADPARPGRLPQPEEVE